MVGTIPRKRVSALFEEQPFYAFGRESGSSMAFGFRSGQSAGMIHGVPRRSRIRPSRSARRTPSGSGRMSRSRSRRSASET